MNRIRQTVAWIWRNYAIARSILKTSIWTSLVDRGILGTVTIFAFGICGLPFYLLHQAYRQRCLGLPRSSWLNQDRNEQRAASVQYLGIECWVIGRTIATAVILWMISWGVMSVPLFDLQTLLFSDLVRLLLVLHLNPKLSQFSQARSLSAIALHYIEAILFFASCYFTFQDGDSFSSGKLSVWQAIYFSSITIATVGYGDISPRDFWAQLIAVIETFSGIVIIVIAIARVMGFQETQAAGRSKGSKNRQD